MGGVEDSEKYEKYIICLEVFKNLSLFIKNLWIFFHNCIKNLDIWSFFQGNRISLEVSFDSFSKCK